VKILVNFRGKCAFFWLESLASVTNSTVPNGIQNDQNEQKNHFYITLPPISTNFYMQRQSQGI